MPVPDLSGLMQDRTATDEGFRLRSRLHSDFVLQHHANAWEVVSEGLGAPTWVPVLSPRLMQVGANGIRTISDSEAASAAYEDALEKDRKHGIKTIPKGMVIASEFLPEGVPEGRYVRSLDAIDPRTATKGKCHVEAWNVPQDVPPDRITHSSSTVDFGTSGALTLLSPVSSSHQPRRSEASSCASTTPASCPQRLTRSRTKCASAASRKRKPYAIPSRRPRSPRPRALGR